MRERPPWYFDEPLFVYVSKGSDTLYDMALLPRGLPFPYAKPQKAHRAGSNVAVSTMINNVGIHPTFAMSTNL